MKAVRFAAPLAALATLLGADLAKADFRHAKLFGARVERSALATANLEGAAGLKF